MIAPTDRAAIKMLAESPAKVLIFPAGTEISFELHAALKNEKCLNLIGAAARGSSHAGFVFDRLFEIDHVSEQGWLDQLIELCLLEEVHFIIPAHDDVTVALARNEDVIPAIVVTSSRQTCEIARSKSATYAHLCETIRTPHIYASDEIHNFPVFAKPDRGQGSAGIRTIRNKEGLLSAISEIPDCIVSEYLPGDEYTVDCFSDREEGLLFAGARIRRRMRNGIAVNTACVALPEATLFAEKVQAKLPFRGAWFLQLKRTIDGDLALLELAPRIAGSMAAHRVRGVNFALLSLYEALRTPVTIRPLECALEMDRALANRYRHDVRFTDVFVDLDDTLITRNGLNTELVAYLLKCVSHNIPVTLITRHGLDVEITLKNYRIREIFDYIFHLRANEPKSEYITGEKPLFIDDSFQERLEVASVTNALCFDLSMMELLYRSAGRG